MNCLSMMVELRKVKTKTKVQVEILFANLLGIFLVIVNGLHKIQITLRNMKKRKK